MLKVNRAVCKSYNKPLKKNGTAYCKPLEKSGKHQKAKKTKQMTGEGATNGCFQSRGTPKWMVYNGTSY